MNIEQMKEKYIEAAEAFYNGTGIKMSDREYDELEKKVLEAYPNFNVKEYVTIHQQGVTMKHHAHFLPYTKSPDASLTYEKLLEFGDKISPKYDGCSIVAYYRNGKCYQIISRADDCYGKNQFDKLINKFNEIFHNIDPSITEVFCEATVNKQYGDRSKANGLINSKYMQDEVDQKLEIKPCECYSEDPLVRRKFCDQYVHQVTKDEMDRIISTGFCDDGTPADGIVAYNPENNNLKMRKIYNNGSAITKVTGHSVTFSDVTLTQSVVNKIATVKVDGANLSNVKMGPYATIKHMGLGIGAEVEVIRVKKIIPYIKRVVTKSDDFSDVTCIFCKKTMKTVGSDLICTNDDCWGMNKTLVRRLYTPLFGRSLTDDVKAMGFDKETFMAGLKKYIEDNGLLESAKENLRNMDAIQVFRLMRIPRFDPKKKIKNFEAFDENIKSMNTIQDKTTPYLKYCSGLQNSIVRITLERVNYIVKELGLED